MVSNYVLLYYQFYNYSNIIKSAFDDKCLHTFYLISEKNLYTRIAQIDYKYLTCKFFPRLLFYFKVQITGDLSQGNNIYSCEDRGKVCPGTTAATLSSSPSSPTIQCTDMECSSTPGINTPMLYYIISGLAGVVVILIILFLVITCLCVIKWKTILKHDNIHIRSTYRSPGKDW